MQEKTSFLEQIFTNQSDFLFMSEDVYKHDDLFSLLEKNSESYEFFLIDGENVSTKEVFLAETAKALKFPEYFGQNWDAFNDSFSELLWSIEKSRVLFIFSKADNILSKAEDRDCSILLSMIRDAVVELSEDESNPSVKIIFVLTDVSNSAWIERMQREGIAISEVGDP